MVVNFDPLVDEIPLEDGGDEIVADAFDFVEINVGSVERFWLGENRAFGVDGDYFAAGYFLFYVPGDARDCAPGSRAGNLSLQQMRLHEQRSRQTYQHVYFSAALSVQFVSCAFIVRQRI